MTRLCIEVPATSANLGPGFDSLGMALDIVDVARIELDPEQAGASLSETTCAAMNLDPHDNLLCRAYGAWAADTGSRLPGARFTVESRIPLGKGLGSSAAAIVCGLAAAAAASEEKEPRDRIVRLGTALEGHADNVVAATLGGVTTSFLDGARVHALSIANHLTLGVALFIPEDRLQTREARAILPETVPLADAAFNVGRVSFLTTALLWARWDRIGPAMQDRLHQPYRARLIPALEPVIAAAVEAGAYGAALSGGGPSVIALGPRESADVFAAAMETRARELDWPGSSLVTAIRHLGVQVKKED